MANYPGLPELNPDTTSRYMNELLLEEIIYDRKDLRLKAITNFELLNHMQRTVYETIIESV